MDSNGTPKQQLVERLKSANNILVTVSRNPSVDQLAACIGLTLVLNKLGKHATAVFSGQVPSTIEFLKPDETIERNTDSLRDFIIALDKSKADKLRYKVEDTVVKIFITPYRTSLSADDLEFSQGDFNVDAVVAIGVKEQQDLDEAIIAHGRILHDATVTTINTTMDAGLGSINWHDAAASSLCELVEEVVHDLGSDLLDAQVSTALLTGIVAETNRFSNEKTTPQTMSVSAALMSAGANQQLVASELGGAAISSSSPGGSADDSAEPATPQSKPPKSDDGTLEIAHQHDETAEEETAESSAQPEASAEPTEPEPSDSEKTDNTSDTEESTAGSGKPSRLITEPPTLGGTLTASSKPDTELEAPADPLSLPQVNGDRPILSHSGPADQPLQPPVPEPSTDTVLQPAPAGWTPPEPPASPPALSLPQPSDEPDDAAAAAPPPLPPEPAKTDAEPAPETLSQLEQEVDSPHLQTPDLDAARSEVMSAINSAPPAPEPIQSLNAQHVDLEPAAAEEAAPAEAASTEFDPQAFGVINDPDVPALTVPEPPVTNPLPGVLDQPASSLPPLPLTPPAPEPAASDPSVPPVPPPLPPSVYAPPTNVPGQQ